MNPDTNTFFLHVAIVAGLIGLFMVILSWPRKKISRQEVINHTRCKDQADAMLASIRACQCESDLLLWEGAVDEFFMVNYDFIGHKMSMKYYDILTLAIIDQRKMLRK